MNRRVVICSEVKRLRRGAVAKASLNRAKQLHVADPKPCDLPMVRVKVG
jgi:hypothetical protein